MNGHTIDFNIITSRVFLTPVYSVFGSWKTFPKLIHMGLSCTLVKHCYSSFIQALVTPTQLLIMPLTKSTTGHDCVFYTEKWRENISEISPFKTHRWSTFSPKGSVLCCEAWIAQCNDSEQSKHIPLVSWKASFTTGNASFPEIKRLGRGINHPSSTEVKERVKVYLYSHSGPSWQVIGWTLPLWVTQGEWCEKESGEKMKK